MADNEGQHLLRLLMLGVGLPHPPETTARLDGVRTIVLFTDGLIEDRPVDIDAAMERLRV